MPQLRVAQSGTLVPAQKGKPPTDFERAVYIPDAHIPHIEEEIFEKLLQFIKDFAPHKVFILGDWVDFYNLSSFDQDPSLFGQLQKELNLGRYYLEQVVEAAPTAELFFMEGNHEARLRRWLWKNPSIASVTGLGLENLLGLQELGFKYFEYGDFYNYNESLIIKHGDVARMHSAYSARAEMEKHGMSSVSGHSHRLSQFYKTDSSGQKVWAEAGCISKMELPWAKNNNWQTGFVYSYIEPQGNRFHLISVPAIRNRFFAEGVYYK